MALLKALALAVGVMFLVGAVLTATSERAHAAAPSADAGTKLYFPATKAAPMPPPRPKAKDGGQAVYFPASKSFGGAPLPGVDEQLGTLKPKQNAP